MNGNSPLSEYVLRRPAKYGYLVESATEPPMIPETTRGAPTRSANINVEKWLAVISVLFGSAFPCAKNLCALHLDFVYDVQILDFSIDRSHS